MPRSHAALCALAALFIFGGSASAAGFPAKPKAGDPYPSGPSTVPYEDVLDHCDLALSGKIKKLEAKSIELEVAKVHKGKHEGKTATIAFDGRWTALSDSIKPPREGATGAFLCIRTKEGKLILAGDPPKGGGFVEEGSALLEKLLVAARDPAKGFASKDLAVKTSSAYRLARAWLAAPKDKKPKLPAGLMEVLVKGLAFDKLRGRHVNAACRDAINNMLNCSIIKICHYSVNHDELKRNSRAEELAETWQRTVEAVRKRRGGKPGPVKPEAERIKAARKRAAELVKQLGADGYDDREKADKALRAMGKVALEAVKAGSESKDVEIADRCKGILAALAKGVSGPAGTKAKFDLDLAEPFVPKAAKKPAPKKDKKE